MSTQKWKLVVTALGGSDVLHELEIEANNWMGALRSGREGLGERPSMPPGASCSIDAEGTATVLDPQGRRKFVLAPLSGEAPGGSPSARPSKGKKRFETVALIPEQQRPPAAEPPQPGSKKKKFQTMAYIPGMELPAAPPATQEAHASKPQPAPIATPPAAEQAAPSPPAGDSAPESPSADTEALAATDPPPSRTPSAAPSKGKKKKRFETIALIPDQLPEAPPQPPQPEPAPQPEPTPEAAPVAAADAAPAAAEAQPAPQPEPGAAPSAGSIESAADALEVLFERSDDPTRDNPLCYRERAYLMPVDATVPDAEAALRWKLAALQTALDERPKGKLVNLAIFDHRWSEAPERPPLIVLQWRDWRGMVEVDFPAAPTVSDAPDAPPSDGAGPAQGQPEDSAARDDRLADTFAALEGLSHLTVPVDGLDYVVGVLEQAIPCEATAACLYDINTDELRFVSVIGPGAEHVQGTAIPRAAGLIGKALQHPNLSSVFDDVMLEPSFNQSTDSRPGLDAHNMIVRPVSHEGHLHGVLHLVNRRDGPGFSSDDANLLSYVADRLCEFLQAVRTSTRPPRS